VTRCCFKVVSATSYRPWRRAALIVPRPRWKPSDLPPTQAPVGGMLHWHAQAARSTASTPRMMQCCSTPRSGSGTSPERTCANARPSPSSSGFQAFLEKAAAIEHQQRRAAGLPTVSAPRHVRQSTCARGPGAHVGVSLDGEEGHASTSLDLAERQSVPVINLLPRPRRGVALGRR